MRLPAPLLRRNRRQFKNDFGHVLIIAGSRQMLGAAALTSLSALRSGAGLVTLAVPKDLNNIAQKKIPAEVMTWPLAQTPQGTFSSAAFGQLKKSFLKFDAIAIGPGISQQPSTARLVLRVIEASPVPLVIDADGLNIISSNPQSLTKSDTPKILTPHPGEMARLTNSPKATTQKDRIAIAKEYAKSSRCVLLLKGYQTLVVAPSGSIYVNRSGNVGMATAGSGDVLTGMIAAFVGQGLSGFNAAKFGAYLHGKAGDIAARKGGKVSLIASDIISFIPQAFKTAK